MNSLLVIYGPIIAIFLIFLLIDLGNLAQTKARVARLDLELSGKLQEIEARLTKLELERKQ